MLASLVFFHSFSFVIYTLFGSISPTFLFLNLRIETLCLSSLYEALKAFVFLRVFGNDMLSENSNSDNLYIMRNILQYHLCDCLLNIMKALFPERIHCLWTSLLCLLNIKNISTGSDCRKISRRWCFQCYSRLCHNWWHLPSLFKRKLHATETSD